MTPPKYVGPQSHCYRFHIRFSVNMNEPLPSCSAGWSCLGCTDALRPSWWRPLSAVLCTAPCSPSSPVAAQRQGCHGKRCLGYHCRTPGNKKNTSSHLYLQTSTKSATFYLPTELGGDIESFQSSARKSRTFSSPSESITDLGQSSWACRSVPRGSTVRLPVNVLIFLFQLRHFS